MIVAISTLWNPKNFCGKKLWIQNNGKIGAGRVIEVTVVDTCMGCDRMKVGQLRLSHTLSSESC